MLLDFLYPPLFLLLAIGALPSGVAAAKPKNAVLLSDVQSLTLRADRQTAHRRVAAVPQLKCVSSKPICALHKVDTMRCTNQGSGYGDQDIQWSCTATLPTELKLGSTEVICEGYSSPDDPYVLKGSCGVEYRLILTDEGERRYPDLARGGGGGGSLTDGSIPAWIFWVVFVTVVVWILYGACAAQQDGYNPAGAPRRRNNYWGGGGGGGPGFGGGGGGGGGGRFGWNDPPPPYPGTKSSTSGEGWRPGFWSGLASGAAAGYYAGNRGRNNNNVYDGGSYGSFGGGSTWGGPGGAGPSRSGSGSSSGSSGARYESTGFGSTSRR